jgi:prespore-specific regulator
MAQERKDSWTQEDDTVLAETVLRHIREGSTQLSAFDEAADRLERTSGACGFRWNSEVRKRYEDEIRQAKAARKEVKAAKPKPEVVVVSRFLEDGRAADYLDQIIHLANNQKTQLANMAKQLKQLNELLLEKNREIEELKSQLDEYHSVPTEITVNEDYRTLLKILQRARQIGAIDDNLREKHQFKMDANGNIEFVG